MSVSELLRGLRWYFRELTGEAEYDRYVERHGQRHPDLPLLTRREFERQRIDRGDEQPGTRCC